MAQKGSIAFILAVFSVLIGMLLVGIGLIVALVADINWLLMCAAGFGLMALGAFFIKHKTQQVRARLQGKKSGIKRVTNKIKH